MATYDSDSDLEDDNYTETNVLLGYATKHVADDSTSQLGGHAVSCFYPTHLSNLLTSADMARRKDDSSRRPGQMQKLQQPVDTAATTQRRPARPLSRPRTPTISMGVQEQGVQEKARKRESL
jgi:hypothetical protein